MSLSNHQLMRMLVEKGLITSDDLSAGGKLNPQQADRFIDFVIDITGLGQMSRVVRFRNEELVIDKIGVGKRVTVPAAEAKDPGVRRGVSTSKVVLKPSEIMTPFELSDTFMEHNIEGDGVEDTVVRMMATQMGNDVEELYINGDLLGRAALESDLLDGGDTSRYVKDSFLALFDGWLRKADGGTQVDLGGKAISANVFSKMLNAMPIKFRRQRSRLRFLMSTELEQLWRERISSRATASGDQALSSSGNLVVFGIEIVPVNLMPFQPEIVEHVTLSGTTAVQLRYSNLVSGSEIVTPDTLAGVPTDKYVEGAGSDYVFDPVAGTIARDAAGAIGDGDTVKVTYQAGPQVILTHMDNLITAVGRDIRIERDRDIFSRMNQWAITTKVDVQFEELTAVVKGSNIASTL